MIDAVCSPGTEVSGSVVHSMWVPGGKVSALTTAVAAAGASTNCFVNTGRVLGWWDSFIGVSGASMTVTSTDTRSSVLSG